jgi:hypothetical protein
MKKSNVYLAFVNSICGVFDLLKVSLQLQGDICLSHLDKNKQKNGFRYREEGCLDLDAIGDLIGSE